jgi:hypothetical protein
MVLVLVLAALGLLVTALITANSFWAWISIVLSVVAGVLLIADWLRRRRKRSAAAAEAEPDADAAAADTDAAATAADADQVEGERPVEDSAAEVTEVVETTPAAEQTELLPASGELDPSSTAAPAVDDLAAVTTEPDKADEPVEEAIEATPEPAVEEEPAAPARAQSKSSDPGEEQTDAADLLIVSELDVEVLVVDEYPRYHVRECVWLADRDTIPIGVSEARELGFTPCDRCGPDAKLATAQRGKRKSSAK